MPIVVGHEPSNALQALLAYAGSHAVAQRGAEVQQAQYDAQADQQYADSIQSAANSLSAGIIGRYDRKESARRFDEARQDRVDQHEMDRQLRRDLAADSIQRAAAPNFVRQYGMTPIQAEQAAYDRGIDVPQYLEGRQVEMAEQQFSRDMIERGFELQWTPVTQQESQKAANDASILVSEFSQGRLSPQEYGDAMTNVTGRMNGIRKQWVPRPETPTVDQHLQAGTAKDMGHGVMFLDKDGIPKYSRYGDTGTQDDLEIERIKTGEKIRLEEYKETARQKREVKKMQLDEYIALRKSLTKKNADNSETEPTGSEIARAYQEFRTITGGGTPEWMPANEMNFPTGPQDDGPQEMPQQQGDLKAQATARARELMQGRTMDQLSPSELQELAQLRAILKGK